MNEELDSTVDLEKSKVAVLWVTTKIAKLVNGHTQTPPLSHEQRFFLNIFQCKPQAIRARQNTNGFTVDCQTQLCRRGFFKRHLVKALYAMEVKLFFIAAHFRITPVKPS